jgi:hypothetical protein
MRTVRFVLFIPLELFTVRASAALQMSLAYPFPYVPCPLNSMVSHCELWVPLRILLVPQRWDLEFLNMETCVRVFRMETRLAVYHSLYISPGTSDAITVLTNEFFGVAESRPIWARSPWQGGRRRVSY